MKTNAEMKANNTVYYSMCCTAPLKAIVTDEGTGFYVCIKCERATDPEPLREFHRRLDKAEIVVTERREGMIVVHNINTIFDAGDYYRYCASRLKHGHSYWKTHTSNQFQVLFRLGNYLISKTL